MEKMLRTAIKSALHQLSLPAIEIDLELPDSKEHGDYATNLALALFAKLTPAQKAVYPKPRDLALAIADTLRTAKLDFISNIEVAGPGFINLYIAMPTLLSQLTAMINDSSYGKNQALAGKKIVVEYTDPNPFKEFHIGHLFSNTIGESLARLFENSGATVWRADYFGDVGMHVAKSIWGLITKLKQEQQTLAQLETLPLIDRIHFLGQAYSLGARHYEDDPKAQADMKELNFVIYAAAQKFLKDQRGWSAQLDYQQFIKTNRYDRDEVFKLFVTCRQWSLDYFETIYARLGTKFDGYYPESITAEYGFKTVTDHQKQYFIVGEGGAIIFPGSRYGLHDRVFINSLGLPTYETKELGLAPLKYEDFTYDQSFIVTGNEINEYFKVLLKAMALLLPRFGEVTAHLGHGMVRLPEGKMSSRTGQVITGISLIDEARERALAIINELNPSLAHKDAVADQIGIAAIKYAFLKSNLGADITFKFEDALTFNGNSGPYLQYTHARCASVLKKAGTVEFLPLPAALPLNSEEITLLKILTRFPQVTANATRLRAPHLVCSYLNQLAQSYNTFYHRHSILGNSTNPVEPPTRNLRLQLSAATKKTLNHGLNLLGIKALEEM